MTKHLKVEKKEDEGKKKRRRKRRKNKRRSRSKGKREKEEEEELVVRMVYCLEEGTLNSVLISMHSYFYLRQFLSRQKAVLTPSMLTKQETCDGNMKHSIHVQEK